MEIFGAAIMVMSLVIAWQTIKNGKWIKGMLNIIHEEGEKRHEEMVEWFKKMDERTAKMDERTAKSDVRAETRHQDVVELLKKGFGGAST